MTPKRTDPLSSRELLQRIGLDNGAAPNLLLGEDDFDSPIDTLAQALQERWQSFHTAHTFKPGDLVSWKPGLRNRRFPRYGAPAIVLEVLDEPVRDNEKDSGNTYFREPLGIVLGLFLHDGEHRGDFLSWHFDARRFQPWQQGDL